MWSEKEIAERDYRASQGMNDPAANKAAGVGQEVALARLQPPKPDLSFLTRGKPPRVRINKYGVAPVPPPPAASNFGELRNDECPCGSGLKMKKCCLNRREVEGSAMLGKIAAATIAAGQEAAPVTQEDVDRLAALLGEGEDGEGPLPPG